MIKILLMLCFCFALDADIINGDVDVSPRDLAIRPIVFGSSDTSLTTSIINHNLKNLSDAGSRLTTGTVARLVLQNTTLTLDADYSFTYTALEIVGNVKIRGCGNTFSLFGSSLLISSGSTLKIDDGVTFDYTPSSSTSRAIIFEDDGSELVLSNATFKVSNGEFNGCSFINGMLSIEGDSNIILDSSSSENALFLGGGVSGDCKLNIRKGSCLNITGGSVISRNINATSFNISKNSFINGKFLSQGVSTTGSTSAFNLSGRKLNISPATLSGETVKGSITGFDTTLTASVFVGAQVRTVAWSPDDKYLAIGGFEGGSLQNAGFGVFEFTGSALNLLATRDYGGDTIEHSDWSPDGKLIAVAIGSASVLNEVEVLSFENGTLSLVTGIPLNATNVVSVKWSPNGQYIAVGKNDTATIEIYQWTGKSLTSVASADTGGSVLSVDWSPDGRLLAVGVDGPTGGVLGTDEIGILEFTGSALNVIATIDYGAGTSDIEEIDWSPDGKFLVVVGEVPAGDFGSNEIGIIKFLGSSLEVVASVDYGSIARTAVWSPDGKFIAVGGNGPSGSGFGSNDIGILEFSGTALTVLDTTDYDGFVRTVKWTSDGNFLAIGGQSPGSALFGNAQAGVLGINYESTDSKDNLTNFVIDKDALINQTSVVKVIG